MDHGGGILIYIDSNLYMKELLNLNIFGMNPYGLKSNRKVVYIYLEFFFSPKTSDKTFFEKLNQNLEKATEITKNVIVLGDFNEDLLLSNNNNLKNVLLINSLKNVISEPTRGTALLDPIIVDFDQTVLDCGVLSIPSEISDHKATWI